LYCGAYSPKQNFVFPILKASPNRQSSPEAARWTGGIRSESPKLALINRPFYACFRLQRIIIFFFAAVEAVEHHTSTSQHALFRYKIFETTIVVPRMEIVWVTAH
jgi:hypothetical protein